MNYLLRDKINIDAVLCKLEEQGGSETDMTLTAIVKFIKNKPVKHWTMKNMNLNIQLPLTWTPITNHQIRSQVL